MVANATSIAACALLGETRARAAAAASSSRRMQEIVDLLRLQDVRLTPALLRDVGEFDESIAFAAAQRSDPRRRPIRAARSSTSRRASAGSLDFYRNAIAALPRGAELPGAARCSRAASQRGAARGPRAAGSTSSTTSSSRRAARCWPRTSTPSSTTSSARGWLERHDGELRATEKGAPYPALPRRADARARRGVLRRRSAAVLATPRPLGAPRSSRARRASSSSARSCSARSGDPRLSNPVTFAERARSAGAARHARAQRASRARARARRVLRARPGVRRAAPPCANVWRRLSAQAGSLRRPHGPPRQPRFHEGRRPRHRDRAGRRDAARS